MTLIELMVAAAVGSLVFAVVASMFLYFGKSFAALTNYAELDSTGRFALDQMTTDIRQANRLTSYATNQIVFEMVASGATNNLTYRYDSAGGTLVRIYAGQTRTLLTEIVSNSLSFSMFQRNPVGGTVDQYATSNPALCKVVQLSWICSRSILGKKSTSESVQSAKIVIRKE
ncbi:MAG: hypothetical protein JWN25_2305 [Verrucomicrobiales bacterium]|nr:hypothetical protein [Verrucomicrobiales bacterium]MDB6129272.1 hypothetical protein [Verrucomicrobiales bacterium]